MLLKVNKIPFFGCFGGTYGVIGAPDSPPRNNVAKFPELKPNQNVVVFLSPLNENIPNLFLVDV